MIKIILAGQYNTPHLIIQIGNKKTAAHTENYANRSNARRAQKAWLRVLQIGWPVTLLDETVKA